MCSKYLHCSQSRFTYFWCDNFYNFSSSQNFIYQQQKDKFQLTITNFSSSHFHFKIFPSMLVTDDSDKPKFDFMSILYKKFKVLPWMHAPQILQTYKKNTTTGRKITKIKKFMQKWSKHSVSTKIYFPRGINFFFSSFLCQKNYYTLFRARLKSFFFLFRWETIFSALHFFSGLEKKFSRVEKKLFIMQSLNLRILKFSRMFRSFFLDVFDFTRKRRNGKRGKKVREARGVNLLRHK